MSKIISFSLYGDIPMHNKGAIANVLLAPEIYPGWKVRIYCCRNNTYLNKLKGMDCEIVEMSPSLEHSGMFWRFLAAWDNEAERVIFRDCDSRLNKKEAAAVKEWEESDLMCHAMHDHPHHKSFPLFGGMWGIKCNTLPQPIYRKIDALSQFEQKRVKDMWYLRHGVHPLVQNDIMRHSSQKLKNWKYIPFPKHSKFKGFVGQQYDEEGNGIWPKL